MTVTVVLTVCLPPVIALCLELLRGKAVGGSGTLALLLAVAGLGWFSAAQLGAGTGVVSAVGLWLALLAESPLSGCRNRPDPLISLPVVAR